MSYMMSLQQPFDISNGTNLMTTGPPELVIDTHSDSVPSSPMIHAHEMAIENVMPGIYLTKNLLICNETNLRSHGFTHIIVIDKHIQQLFYPITNSKFFMHNSNESVSLVDQHSTIYPIINDTSNNTTTSTSSSSAASSLSTTPIETLSFGTEFKILDLNFGEESYLTRVLPNCYRAVKFINRALQAGGTILVIDCNVGEQQKCITIVVAYLMYKHNSSLSIAFGHLKKFYERADLDRFYMSQLYEYEPILQVQRAQSRGHSCSRELHAAMNKRKKLFDDDDRSASATNEFYSELNHLSQYNTPNVTCAAAASTLLSTSSDVSSNTGTQTLGCQQRLLTHQQKSISMSPKTTGHPNSRANNLASNWDDYAME